MLQKHCEIWQSNTETKKNLFNKEEQELDKPQENSKFQSFLNSFLADCTCIHSYTYNSDNNTNYNIYSIWTI